MKSLKLWIPLLLTAGMIMMGGCRKKSDLTATETTGVTTGSAVTSGIETTTAPADATTAQETSSAAKTGTVQADSKTYQKEGVRISYPELGNLKNEELSTKINEKIRENIESAVEAMKPDAATQVDVKEEIISANDKRISIAYTGTMTLADGSTKKIFFTNNIDANTGKDLGLSDFVDPQTMAGYILSNDVKLHQASAEITEMFFNERHNTSYDEYVELLSHSDFPLDTDSEGKITSFPQSFSYEKNGNIYFSIPVSAKLGDYVIIVYSPDSK